MLEDTNSLDGAQLLLVIILKHIIKKKKKKTKQFKEEWYSPKCVKLPFSFFPSKKKHMW